MKRIQKVKLFFATLVIIVAMGTVFYFLPLTSWSPPPPSVAISGETALERVASLQAYLNVKDGAEDNFWKFFFEDYNAKTRIWKFTIMIADPYLFDSGSSDADQQLKLEKFFGILKETFVDLAKWDETAEGVIVRVSVPISFSEERPMYSLLYLVDKEGLANIRSYPDNWALYMYKPEQLIELPQSELEALTQGGGSDAQ